MGYFQTESVRGKNCERTEIMDFRTCVREHRHPVMLWKEANNVK